jgi:hypothetical protein
MVHMQVILFGYTEQRQLISFENQLKSKEMIDTFNTLKQVIWNCVMDNTRGK